jgi:hypothetical protein
MESFVPTKLSELTSRKNTCGCRYQNALLLADKEISPTTH